MLNISRACDENLQNISSRSAFCMSQCDGWFHCCLRGFVVKRLLLMQPLSEPLSKCHFPQRWISAPVRQRSSSADSRGTEADVNPPDDASASSARALKLSRSAHHYLINLCWAAVSLSYFQNGANILQFMLIDNLSAALCCGNVIFNLFA